MNWYKKAISAKGDYRPIGQRCWFEYHCYESHDSSDAKLWYHSHQPVTILKLDYQGGGLTKRERAQNGHPAVYRVVFEDGFTKGVYEDELLDSPHQFTRPNPPQGAPLPPPDEPVAGKTHKDLFTLPTGETIPKEKLSEIYRARKPLHREYDTVRQNSMGSVYVRCPNWSCKGHIKMMWKNPDVYLCRHCWTAWELQ